MTLVKTVDFQEIEASVKPVHFQILKMLRVEPSVKPMMTLTSTIKMRLHGHNHNWIK